MNRPFANINDISIHYQLEGDKDAPVLMLCNSLGTTLEMDIRGQIPMDIRGQIPMDIRGQIPIIHNKSIGIRGRIPINSKT